LNLHAFWAYGPKPYLSANSSIGALARRTVCHSATAASKSL